MNPFAKGGIVTGPTAALIGEAGAEAVIPLHKPLSQIDPAVRGMAALVRGENQGGYAAQGGSVTNNTHSAPVTNTFNIQDMTGDAEATAQKVINRMALGI